jgi:hypothetical protein
MRPCALALIALIPTLARAAPLYSCRVAYAPLEQKLAAAHQSRADILHPASAHELARLQSDKRYKFILDAHGALAIAPLPADAPGNEFVHPILAGGAEVQSAGGITVAHSGDNLTRVTLDQDSKAYCPDFASLETVAAALVKLGVPRAAIARQDRAPTGCGKS